MDQAAFNANDAPTPQGGYSQAVRLSNWDEMLFISGQVPVALDGSVAADFPAQAAQAWANLDAQLRAAGFTRENLVKVTVFLSSRDFAMENRRARQDYLGQLAPAMSVVIAGIFDSNWLLEIEAVAAR